MVNRQLCTGCGACAAVCPRDAVRMEADGEGFFYPVIRKSTCTDCGLCTRTCPLTRELSAPGENACFGAKAREEARQLGSSGGIFPVLAAQILRDGGTVWGASLSEGGMVRHMEIGDEADIPKITRTKYVQSDLTPVWGKIRASVEGGRPVLFCGTPCQTDAVRSFFGEDHKGLILVDLVCYGVPSPGIWKKYVAVLSRRYGGTVHSFSFRDKRNRDHGHTCSTLIGGQEYCWPLDRDPYCQSMFRNVNLRPSCFHCRYCTPARNSDITLGDFWGIEQVRPDFDDGMGCSAVICHTQTGRQLWEQVQPEVQWFACEEQELANDRQPRLREPVQPHPKRALYMALMRVMPFSLWIKLFR